MWLLTSKETVQFVHYLSYLKFQVFISHHDCTRRHTLRTHTHKIILFSCHISLVNILWFVYFSKVHVSHIGYFYLQQFVLCFFICSFWCCFIACNKFIYEGQVWFFLSSMIFFLYREETEVVKSKGQSIKVKTFCSVLLHLKTKYDQMKFMK